MAKCRVTTGVDLNCEAINKIGGMKQKLWVFSSLEGFEITTGVDGYVSGITFPAYEGLVPFTGSKNGHSGGSTVQVTEGGNRFLQHNVSITLMPDTPTDDESIIDLINADVPMILEDKNGDFFLYGVENGMSISEGTQTSGNVAATAIGDVLTFIGEEKKKPLRVLDTDRVTTLALLESYEI